MVSVSGIATVKLTSVLPVFRLNEIIEGEENLSGKALTSADVVGTELLGP